MISFLCINFPRCHCCRLGSNPDKLFPYSALESQLRTCGKFALVMASFLIPIMMSEADIPIAGDPALNENKAQAPDLSKALKERMRDVVADMYRLGYI